MKERTWLGILLSFAAPCRRKMAGSVVLAILSVAGGFVPYLGVYQIIRLFLERQADWEGIVFWCGVCLAGYAVKVAGYALSTMLAHVSAYTILEGLRLQVADRLMGAPLGEVESRWAMTSSVFPLESAIMERWILSSFSGSVKAVASSKITIGASFKMARAMAMR